MSQVSGENHNTHSLSVSNLSGTVWRKYGAEALVLSPTVTVSLFCKCLETFYEYSLEKIPLYFHQLTVFVLLIQLGISWGLGLFQNLGGGSRAIPTDFLDKVIGTDICGVSGLDESDNNGFAGIRIRARRRCGRTSGDAGPLEIP